MQKAEYFSYDADAPRLPDWNSPGIYVVKTKDPQYPNVYRFGKKQDCVASRMKQHGGPTGLYDNLTGDLMPFAPVCGWTLPKWPPHRVTMAEQVMFGALKEQGCGKFSSPMRQARNESIYVIGSKFNWEQFKVRVANELNTLLTLGV